MKSANRTRNVVGGYKVTDNQGLIEWFKESGLDRYEVPGVTPENANSRAISLRRTIDYWKYFNVRVITRKGRVYLIKGEL